MTIKGKGMNLQVLAECACYLLFGALLFHLTYSGRYLNYVTPRMKPYLYGMSALMLLWVGVSGRYILTPQYRIKLARTFVFIIPILLLAVRPASPSQSSMVRSYNGSGISMAAANGGGRAEGASGQPVALKGGSGSPVALKGGSGPQAPPPESGAALASPSNGETAPDAAAQSNDVENQWYSLNGLDKASKTITIADDDYYTWMYELSSSYEKYVGYTVVMKGFIYRDAETLKKGSFALVRLSMWCCSADLTPMGFIVKSDKKVEFKDDDWVTVKGTLGITDDGKSIALKAQSIKAAEKPKEEYVYPYF